MLLLFLVVYTLFRMLRGDCVLRVRILLNLKVEIMIHGVLITAEVPSLVARDLLYNNCVLVYNAHVTKLEILHLLILDAVGGAQRLNRLYRRYRCSVVGKYKVSTILRRISIQEIDRRPADSLSGRPLLFRGFDVLSVLMV